MWGLEGTGFVIRRFEGTGHGVHMLERTGSVMCAPSAAARKLD